MTDTPNHGYNRPEEGKTDWHLDLNENFAKIDADVEIRDTEANKGDYDPKEGAKYEATDSGAVYYGNGDAWVLADRKLDKIESEEFASRVLLDAEKSGTAVVAPSQSTAFDSMQSAIDAGFDDILLGEEITENNIVVSRDGMIIRGWGRRWQRIIDPQDGAPVFTVDGSRRDITIKNIRVEGGSGSGPVIDTRYEGDVGASLWEIYDCLFNAGPIIMLGPRNQLRHVTCNNKSDIGADVNILPDGKNVSRAALILNGATFGIIGGSYSSKSPDAREAMYLSGGAGTVTGGVTISNSGGENSTGTLCDLMIFSAGRIFFGPMSMESTKEYNIRLGFEGDGPGLINGVFTGTGFNPLDSGPDAGWSKIKVGSQSENITFISPHSNIKFENDAPARIYVISQHKVKSTGHLPHLVNHSDPFRSGTHRVGGRRDSPSTQFLPKIHTTEPPYPVDAGMVIADGANWDPVGTGNAALVTRDTDGTWSVIFEYSSSV
ncbi:hypothetical protein [Halorientalis persicus]|nr:hypothetical protein [Halorientalis persicus]